MVSHSFSDRCHPSASFGVSLFNEFAAGRNARRTAESVLLVSLQSIIGKGDIGSRRLSRNVISSEVEKSFLPCGYPCQCENENRRLCVSFPCCITSAVMVCQKDPSAALGMTKRGADGFSLVFRSLPSIRFLRCVPLQRFLARARNDDTGVSALIPNP